jgi:hypothetical protein
MFPTIQSDMSKPELFSKSVVISYISIRIIIKN